MKKILSHIFMFGAVAALTLSSCAKKEVYEPGEPDAETCYGVYFPTQEASGSHTYDPEAERVITITVARSQEKPFINDAITVPYTAKASAEGIFEEGIIKFEAGQSETTLEITFDKAKLGTKYELGLEITDNKYVSMYSSKATYLNLDILVVAWQYVLNPQTNEKALFTFNQNWWSEIAYGYVKYYEVNGVRTCYTETIKHVYIEDEEPVESDNHGFWGYGDAYEWEFIWYPNEAHPEHPGSSLIKLPFQPTGFVYQQYGMIYTGDALCFENYLNNENYDWLANAKKGNFKAGYYDGNGAFYFAVDSYLSQSGSRWSVDDYDTVGIGEGFIRTDYSLKLKSDYPSNGNTPIYVEAGVDIASIKYAIFAGILNNEEISAKAKAIASGSQEGTTFSDFELDEEEYMLYATLMVAPEATGSYTLVVVGFDDENKAQTFKAVGFDYISADDQKDHEVKLEVATEKVPARYGDYPASSSFAFYVMGKNIDKAHINVYPTTVFEDNKEAILAEMKEAPATSEVYVATQDVLNKINVPGGYYTFVSDLSALTSYTVVVYATNGEMETWATAEFTTDDVQE